MAQMTDDMAKHIVDNYEASKSRYPLTAWEICQLAQRWLATSNASPQPEQPAIDLEQFTRGIRFHDADGIAGTIRRLRRYASEGSNTRNLLGQTMAEAADIMTNLLAIIDGAKAGKRALGEDVELAVATINAAAAYEKTDGQYPAMKDKLTLHKQVQRLRDFAGPIIDAHNQQIVAERLKSEDATTPDAGAREEDCHENS